MPRPYGVLSVSPSWTSTSAAGMPSSSATIWAKVVMCPWPWVCTPSFSTALPVGCTRSSAESNMRSPAMSYSAPLPAPTTSVKLATPMPMSSPRARFSACSRRSSS